MDTPATVARTLVLCTRPPKLWVDEVLAFGWAYGPGGTALHGKAPLTL